MAYCDQTNVQTRAGGLTQLIKLSGGDGEVNAQEVASAIEEADGIIDGIIGKRWATPLTVVGAAIKWSSARLTILVLKDRRHQSSREGADQVRWEQELNLLVAIAEGKQLPSTTATPSETSSHVVDRNTARPETKAISRAELKGFV